jgi:hypothetical protein
MRDSNVKLDSCKWAIKAGFYYGKNRDKLVSFKEQKKIFCILKPTNLAQFLQKCKYSLNQEAKVKDHFT